MDTAFNAIPQNREGRETPGGRGGSFPTTERQFKDACGTCGATRKDKQLGLEPTPQDFVDALVQVFREVRRVLRDDGCVWLNLGDSFGPGKQLQGIPWRVAMALQADYYTGTIRDERDRIWLAAMIDGEGCMFIHKRKVGQSNGQGYLRKTDSYGAGLEVSSTDRCIVEKILAITGRGSICEQSPEQNERRKQTIYRWNLRSNECREVIREVYPHLVAKQHEARLVIGCPSSGPQASLAHESLKAIHQGGTPGIDFAPPASMFEGGWCLRSDIIWAKLQPNPMPESVTDRPTRAHEFIFLLAKNSRYFYDADAIRESLAPTTLSSNGIDPASGRGYVENRTMTWEERNRSSDPGGNLATGASRSMNLAGRNKRDVWTVSTKPYPGAHFATFPVDLIEPCVLAGCPERACGACGAPWERIVENRDGQGNSAPSGGPKAVVSQIAREAGGIGRLDGGRRSDEASTFNNNPAKRPPPPRTVGFEPSCTCNADPVPGTVLDPFAGAGTTGLVAVRNRRSFIGLELNPEYAQMARDRIATDIRLGHRAPQRVDVSADQIDIFEALS
jgi:DNA modification methylase